MYVFTVQHQSSKKTNDNSATTDTTDKKSQKIQYQPTSNQ